MEDVMTGTTGLSAFDTTIQESNTWLKDIMEEEGWKDRHRAYKALRSVLHVLRDRLTPEEAAHLGAELPMLIRGIYYEGWKPAEAPKKRTKEAFLSYVAEHFQNDPDIDPEEVIRSVFTVIESHVAEGQVANVKAGLPEELRRLWPR
jgi:uncharacterized protein (DUF2267 family)